MIPPPSSDPPVDSSFVSPLLQIRTSCHTQTNLGVPSSESHAHPPIQTNLSPGRHAASLAGPSVQASPTPQTCEYSPVSELSDLEKSSEKKAPETEKKTTTKKGKKKTTIPSLDEEQGAESLARPHYKVLKKGKK